MQADATGHHWMTGAQFLNGVALGQITPGPVVQTAATVGPAAGIGGGLLAALVALTAVLRHRDPTEDEARTGPAGLRPAGRWP